MLEKLAPEFRFASLTDIETEWLKEHQFEALVLDIDNTLLARDCTRIPADHLFWPAEPSPCRHRSGPGFQ